MQFSALLACTRARHDEQPLASLLLARDQLGRAVRLLWDGPPPEAPVARVAEQALAAALRQLHLEHVVTPAAGRAGQVTLTEALEAATTAHCHLTQAIAADEPAEALGTFLAIALEALADARRAS